MITELNRIFQKRFVRNGIFRHYKTIYGFALFIFHIRIWWNYFHRWIRKWFAFIISQRTNRLIHKWKTNPNHAQLICTSHQPLLLDGDYRRDQVWITEKDAYGKSTLHRLSEKSTPRAKINLTSKILEGAFGCNPDKFFA